jgi:hypothetical protein
MAYERTRGAHQAAVLYRVVHQERFPLAEVARRAELDPGQVNDWAANRQPVPQWATPRLVAALEELEPGAGVSYLTEALRLVDLVVAMPLPRRLGGCPTEQARKVQRAAQVFVAQVIDALTDDESPGRIDEREVAALEPARRELLAAVAAYGAAAVRAARAQRRMAFAGAPA